MAHWNTFYEDTSRLVEASKQISLPLENPEDLDPTIERIGEAQLVLLGEATHGTAEFYRWRALLSQRLVSEKGFDFIAVEGDWPDCYRINHYIKNYPNAEESAYKVVHAFQRWPTWMWANWETIALAEWLRSFNTRQGRKIGFYGLDVYSLYESMHMIVDYLEKKDPDMAKFARQAYHCFEPFGEDVQSYTWNTRMVPDTCEDEVIDLLHEMQRNAPRYDGDPEAGFNAEQNALVMVNAERYYRAMVRSDQNSWNVRDIHMADTLDRLIQFHGENSKGIVWAHNTHVGDARATDMAPVGMVNIGQLMRERKGEENVFLIGFGTHHGTTIAAKQWDAPMEVVSVPDAMENSWEDVLHRVGEKAFFLLLREKRAEDKFAAERGQRSIGVVYQPEHERRGNYVPTQLPNRYDAFIFLDETQALHPLHLQPQEEHDIPEMYPWGL